MRSVRGFSRRLGISVLRFANAEVEGDLDFVLGRTSRRAPIPALSTEGVVPGHSYSLSRQERVFRGSGPLVRLGQDVFLRSRRADPQLALRGAGRTLAHQVGEHPAMPGRRTAGYWFRPPTKPRRRTRTGVWTELALVNLIRERVKEWRAAGRPGVTRTTLELIQWWRREGREKRLFFAQFEAAETIIFLTEARADFLQGIDIPRDEPSDDRKAEGFSGVSSVTPARWRRARARRPSWGCWPPGAS